MPVVGTLGVAGHSHDSSVTFYLNGQPHTVSLGEGGRWTARSSLNEYIREAAGLSGTKVMCRESGCGCCAVTVTIPNPLGSNLSTVSINSCLCPLLSVDGWQVTTVEGIGNDKEGFHPIQKRIADFNGTQCGYCTPGMVMTMYGLLHSSSQPTEQEVEDNFDGNICRCTGYRSILDSMKSFAKDTSIAGGGLIDIEDLNKKLCPRTGQPCKDHPSDGSLNGAAKNGASNGSSAHLTGLHLRYGGVHWYRPNSLQELSTILRKCMDDQVRMLFGNTSTGIFKDEGPFEVYVDLRGVKELYEITVTETSAKFGANTSLTSLIQQLTSLKDTQPGFQYFAGLVRHLNLVGNVLMRNAACVAGNLMIKHAHPDFPSDVFTMMEAAGGKVEVFDTKDESLKAYTVQDFVMKVNMKGKVLTALEIPAFEPLDHFRSFKITPRSQNAHAYINAGFRFKISQVGKQVLGRPAIVIGGVNNKFIHAEKTEEFLRGKTLKDEIVRDALALMKSEISPTPDPVLSSVEYRTDLAVNLLYKTLLEFTGNADPRLASGAPDIQRPLSSGLQTYEEKKDEFPLKQALPKTTALLQASGQAEFVNDLPTYKHELCGALVLTTVPNCTLQSVDPSAALAMPGVHHFITARDIPQGGSNNAFASYQGMFIFPVEEIFVTEKVVYAGQAVGMILADNQRLADEAAKKVIVKYSDIQKPILTIQDAIDANSFHSTFVQPHVVGNPDEELEKSARTLSGEIKIGSQYHFYMETIAALCVPSEDAMEVYATSQAPDILQCCMSGVLNKPVNYVNVHALRLGGGFGGKFVQSNHLTNAAAIAAYTTGRPVRISLSLSTNMQYTGMRFPVLARYKAGFSENGKLNAILADIYIDGGATSGIVYGMYELQHQLDQGFYVPNWKINPYMAKTNRAPTTYCRGPGPTPAAAIMETILEHVAKEVKQHPILVKELNLYERHQTDLNGIVLTYCTMRDVWQRLKQVAQVEQRMAEVEEFNRGNLWKKKGITMCAAKYGMVTVDTGFPCSVSVFAQDGTVTVVQGGVDMGQGLYTKVAQVVAHTLGIPMDMIKIRPCVTNFIPNGPATGGSTTSERAVNAALRCCTILREKMEPLRAKMPDADWKTLCLNAYKFKVDLAAHATPFNADLPESAGHFNYHTYCAGVMQTELDVLTGEYAISRVDIMFDCGESLNPMIDIGQIEGGFVMGLGFSLLEDIVFDTSTGRVLNDGTWEYKPPTSKDIPIDWRIHMLPDAPNPVGVRSSKASGEPPTSLGVGVLLALKQSMEDAQKDLTGSSSFIPVDIPLTVEKIQQGIGTKVDHMRM